MAVLIDTSALMAYRNTKDVHHEKVDRLIRRALKGEFSTIYTTYHIYDKALTIAVVRTGNKSITIDTSNVILSPGIEMVIIDKNILEQATTIFFKFFDKLISFTDTTTIVVMHRDGIDKIITFDANFKEVFDVLDG